MAEFARAYSLVRRYEGGWCHVKGDPGGETYAGIARNFFPAWPGWSIIDSLKDTPFFKAGPNVFSRDLASMPKVRALVEDFYRREWWDKLGLSALPQGVADEIFEQAVNLGKAGAGKQVQRLCNALNANRKGDPLFSDIAEDGAIGPKTIAALNAVLGVYEWSTIVLALNALQAAHYVDVAARNPEKRRFMRGWLSRTAPDTNSVTTEV